MPNTWLRDRESFIATMSREGMALDDIRRVLRAAQKWRQDPGTRTSIAAARLVDGFYILHSSNYGHTTIRKETGTAWYRVPTRS